MKKCIICESEKGKGFKKTLDGYICKKCRAYIPISVHLPTAKGEFLKKFYNDNCEKEKVFESTANLGMLYLDSFHGLICISKKHKKDSPTEFHDIYYLSELTNVGLFCSGPKTVSSNSRIIVCDIKFKMSTEDISNEFTLFSNKSCPYRINGKDIEWSEPYNVSVFREIFNQAVEDMVFNAAKKFEYARILQQEAIKPDESEAWARGVLFIDEKEELSPSLVKEKRNNLVKKYHPDASGDYDNNEITAMINSAYKRLI